MATRSRTGIESRLADLERRRDLILDQIVDRYFTRGREVIGGARGAAFDAGEPPTPAELATLRTDPLAQRLDVIYTRMASWRRSVQLITGRQRTDDDE